MTRKERAIFDKADANYKSRQKRAGEQYRSDLKRGLQDKASRVKDPIARAVSKEKDILADRGDYGVFGHVLRSSIRQVQGETAARAVGSVLIKKKALRNNPNLSVNSKELLRQAGKTGRIIGSWYARGETAAAMYEKKKRDSIRKETGNRKYRFSN